MTDTFEFFTGLRGFCVCCNTVKWVPYVGQNIIFKCEYNNKRDRFAVAGKTLLKGCIAPITVGHVPRELSRHTWHVIQEGAQFKAMVHNTKARPPLAQSELEIPIRVKVVRSQVEKLSMCITKVEEIKYLVTGDYVDTSKEILLELVYPEAVESLDDEDEELGNTKDENREDNEITEQFNYSTIFLS